jgi:hypothetical protein
MLRNSWVGKWRLVCEEEVGSVELGAFCWTSEMFFYRSYLGSVRSNSMYFLAAGVIYSHQLAADLHATIYISNTDVARPSTLA